MNFVTIETANNAVNAMNDAKSTNCAATKKAAMMQVAEILRLSHKTPLSREVFEIIAPCTMVSKWSPEADENGLVQQKNQHQTVATHGRIDNVPVQVVIPGAFGAVNVSDENGEPLFGIGVAL
jgi:hypothetical protein